MTERPVGDPDIPLFTEIDQLREELVVADRVRVMLEEKLAAERRDAERLDWLEKHLFCDHGEVYTTQNYVRIAGTTAKEITLRAAIDAAKEGK